MDAMTTKKNRQKKPRNRSKSSSMTQNENRRPATAAANTPDVFDELSRDAFLNAADDMFDAILQWCFANQVAPARGLREVVNVLGETLHETVADEESELAKEIDLAAYEACTLLADEVMYRVFGKLAESGDGDARDLALAMDQLSAFMRDMGSPEAFLEACAAE